MGNVCQDAQPSKTKAASSNIIANKSASFEVKRAVVDRKSQQMEYDMFYRAQPQGRIYGWQQIENWK